MTHSGNVWRFAWSVFWKTAVGGIIVGVVVNVVLSFFLPALLMGFGMSPEVMLRSVTYVAYAVSAVVYFVVLKFVLESSLGKNIGGIQLDYAERNTSPEASHAH